MATIDRAVAAPAGPADGDGGGVRGRARPSGRWAGWWWDLFTPVRGWPPAVDILIAQVIVIAQIFGTLVYSIDELSRWAFDVYAPVLLTVGPFALLFRRRWPEATLIVAFAAAASYEATGYPRGPAGYAAFLFALVSAIMMGRRAFAWSVVLVAYPTFVLLPSLHPDEVEQARSLAGRAVNLTWWMPLAGAASEIARIRLERGAERAHMAREEARRRASEERQLIARELHDVLAHNISLINVRSGVALHLLDERPEQARPALEAINEASEDALTELRSVLDVLSRGLGEDGTHGEDGADRDSGGRAPHSPVAGLRDLDGLVQRTRAVGLDVHLVVEGEIGPVPTGVDLAAFRIVQEALTNVVRHAGGDARATVRLLFAPNELLVQVDDDGLSIGPTAGEGVGRGISGMRERVHALGGTFSAGPRPGRGFRVRAQFPFSPDAAGQEPTP